MALENGYLLNQRYRIVAILGQGGMGAVYRAVDENLDTTVAVKENSFYSEDYARQFEREARILASLRHPNLPRVFDYFVIDQQGQYLVMDYIEGDDLRQWMARRPEITEIEALQIGITICNALIYLHTRVPAIAHRDIKPGNVKITPSGDLILVDFGLVKVLNNKEITTSAARAMTPGYSPPEQYSAEPTDHRSDIFSLGATLYAALAGYLPEDSLARTTGKASLTPLREHNPSVTRKTAQVIEKALELRFDDRWQTTAEFREALIEARNTIPQETWGSSRLKFPSPTEPEKFGNPSPDSSQPGWRRKLKALVTLKNGQIDPVWVVFGGMILVLLIALIISLLRPEGLQSIVAHSLGTKTLSTAGLSSQTNTTADSQMAGLATDTAKPIGTLQADGEQTPMPTKTPHGGSSGSLAYVSERSGLPQIWEVELNGRRSTQLLALPDGACQPDWSPDGKQIVFTSPCSKKRDRYPGSSLFILDVPSGEVSPLLPSLEGDFDPAWSPDGEWIAYTSLINGQMQLMKAHVEDLRVIRLSDGRFDDSNPTWSTDGSRLAFVRIRSVGQIWLMDPDGENSIQFTLSGAIDNSNPEWYPNDRLSDGSGEGLLLFSQVLGLGSPSKQLFGMRLEDQGKAEEYPLIRGLQSDYIPLMDNVAASPDGFWLAFDYWYFDVLSDIYMMAFPGGTLIQLTDHPAMDYDPVWRPAP